MKVLPPRRQLQMNVIRDSENDEQDYIGEQDMVLESDAWSWIGLDVIKNEVDAFSYIDDQIYNQIDDDLEDYFDF